MTTKRLFSGIQPTGVIHIGNWFGAIRNWIDLIPRFDCIYCIVDYHAITVEYDPADMGPRVLDAAATLIAAGVDPEKCRLFVQSSIPEHTELAWIFNSVCSIGALERMTQFKDKAVQHKENVNAGLFTYPVLQAADIMLYRAEAVPVGEDQLQHLELTREISRRFNHRFGPLFPECKEELTPTPRVVGLDGQAKMSKSIGNHVALCEEAEDLKNKIMPAKTDENRKRRTDPGNPDICTIYSYHKLFSEASTCEDVNRECRVAGIGCVDCKKRLLGNMETVIAPIRERRHDLLARPDDVRSMLAACTEALQPLARETMSQVRQAMGLR